MIKVWTDVGERRPVPLLARIVEQDESNFIIRYLIESDDKVWRYEEDTYEIDEDSIQSDLGTSLETDLGFKRIGETEFVKFADEASDDEN